MIKREPKFLSLFILIILFVGLSPATIFPLEKAIENISINLSRLDIDATEPGGPADSCFQQGCHLNMAEQTRQYTHAPFAEGRCDYCHIISPAHTKNCEGCVSHIASIRDIEVCERCHPLSTLESSHPVGGIDPQTGDLMTCTSTCHDPHTASNDKMLRYPNSDGLCLLCHEIGQ